MSSKHTPEQRARDTLERLGMDDAQAMSAGDVAELANLIALNDELLEACKATDHALTGLAQHEPRSAVGKALWAGMRDAQHLASAVIAKAPKGETSG